MTERGSSEQQHVEVAVVTTSGTYPEEGHVAEPAHQSVDEVLKKAAKKLTITNTAGWIAKVGSREIIPTKTYIENALSGTIDIDWGPREGGGGAQ